MITYTIDKQLKTVFMKGTGEVDAKAVIEAMERVSKDPDHETGMNSLVDFTEVIPAKSLNFSEMMKSQNAVSTLQEVRGDCKWAIVVSTELGFGLVRMFTSLCEGLRIKAQVFRDMTEARVWLGME